MEIIQKLQTMLSVLLLGVVTASADNDDIIITNLQGGTYLMRSNTYIVKDNLTYNMQAKGYTGSALKVADNTTSKLIIPEGVTFTLWGSNAAEGKPAYPAIELPESSTLIIEGDGRLIVHGGSGLNKTNGASGENGYHDHGVWDVTFRSGFGGKGGRGSYGNAAGIGTPGGIGGAGGNAPAGHYDDHTLQIDKADNPSYKGGDGGDGRSSADMGRLYVLGNVQIESYIGGLAYPAGSYVEEVSAKAGSNWTEGSWIVDYSSVAGGGGGGNGGTCCSINYAICAGAPGAGGGGAGGSGGVDTQYYKKYFDIYPGHGGIGGDGDLRKGANGLRGHQDKNNSNGGKPGLGGKAGIKGNNGWVTYAPNVSIVAKTSSDAPGGYIFKLQNIDADRSTNLCEISYKELLDKYKTALNRMHGASVANSMGEPAFYQGMKLTGFFPDVEVPSASGNTYFLGYADQYGNQVFDEKGHLAIELEKYAPANGVSKNTKVYAKDAFDKWYVETYRDITLYAVWKDSVTVIVRHIIEDPECMDGDHQSCFSSDRTQVFTETMRYGIDPNELVKIKSSAFCDLDGKPIEALNYSDKRLYLPVGAASTKEVTLDKEQIVIEHLYLRKSFTLAWDYTAGGFTKDEISASLMNESSYTKAGKVKYGKQLIYPELKPVRGKIICGWSPDMSVEMPTSDLTLKAEVKDMLFNVTDAVDRGSTACSLKLSSASATYGQTVTIDVTLEEATHLANFEVKTLSDQSKVNVTQVNDSQYSFVMPNDHVTVSGEFVLTKSHIVNIQSTKEAHFALYDNDSQKLYTDDTDFFGVTTTDEAYGGPLKDFEVYKSKRIDIVAMLDQTESNKALRPTVSMNRKGSDLDEETTMSRRLINGRERKVFSYYATDASDLTINVQWSKKTAKEITLLNALGTRFSTISSDVQNDIKCTLSTGKTGAMAYVDDYITFEVSTKDATFSSDNIFAWYLDASTRQIPVEVSVDKDSLKADNFICRYQMPDRDMTIKLELGKKVAINVMLPDENYGYYAPDSAVVGSVIPFGVVVRHDLEDGKDLNMIKHPLGLYNQGQEAVKADGFGEVETTRTDCEFSFGTFVVPDDDSFVIANGILLHPQLYNDWFTFYCDETVMMPANVKVYDISLDEENQLELQPRDSQKVMAMDPVVCHIDREDMVASPVDNRLSCFLPIDPKDNENLLPIPTTGIHIRGNIDPVDCVTLMADCSEGEQIYRLDYDMDNQVPFFRVAEEDFRFGANTVYLRLNKTKEPVYPTAINTIAADKDKSSDPVYNLFGMPVDGYYKGIVIKKGKKTSIW